MFRFANVDGRSSVATRYLLTAVSRQLCASGEQRSLKGFSDENL